MLRERARPRLRRVLLRLLASTRWRAFAVALLVAASLAAYALRAPAAAAARRAAELGLGEESAVWAARREAVREAAAHAFAGYARWAFGHDEVRPLSNRTNDSWGGFGVTAIDGLDTLLLLGLRGEAERVIAHIATLNFTRRAYVASFFETTIRHLGGLLGAFELTGDARLLAAAAQLGEALWPAERVGALPPSKVNLQDGRGENHAWANGKHILAEAGSFQLEFRVLAARTGRARFTAIAADAVAAIARHAHMQEVPGLFSVLLEPSGAPFGSHFGVGSLADSFYEYLLKSFVLTARTPEPDLLSLRLYNSAARGVLEHLVQRTATFPPTVYIAERKGGRVIHRTEHLACFFPGTLALGFIVTAPDYASALSREARESPEFAALNASRLVHIDAAIKLARTCVALYDASPSRLAPDSARLAADGRSLEAEDPKFLLRPETAESLFLLFRATGDARWREDGWRIFQAIQRQCRTPTAYSGAADTRRDPAVLNDSMQSFFLAETVKYLFLLFAPRDAFDLAQWVLTTEAHPLRVL